LRIVAFDRGNGLRDLVIDDFRAMLESISRSPHNIRLFIGFIAMELACVSDLRTRAKRRLPDFVFDYLDGGAGAEAGVRRNEQAFNDLQLNMRALVNVETRDLSTRLFGRTWAAPFGVAPVGLGNLIWPGADEAIVRAAVATNLPYTLSTAATISLERIAEIAPQHAWFQLYVARRDADVADLVDRVEQAGYDVLLVTVDVPVPARRLRDIRNRFTVPFRITPSVAFTLLTHPSWSLATLRAGVPRFINVEKYADAFDRRSIAAYLTEVRGRYDWDDLKRLRDRWPRRLVIKGLMTAEDGVRARDLGCDGIVVSNHGGRQLDSAPATLDVLPDIRAAVGPDFVLILDSGVRSGEHIVKALAAGADFVLIGRAVMYALAAYGTAAAGPLFALMIDEASRCLGQIGYPDVASLKAHAPFVRKT
jgi:isopentenyl diphosphate isomerase/L-lactate dehydrogenase-like FMN-dependent dehydrogenase